MIDATTIQRIAELAKDYASLRRKYDRLAAQAYAPDAMERLSAVRRGNLRADMTDLAAQMIRKEASLHAACIEAGVADLRSADHYAERDLAGPSGSLVKFAPARPSSPSLEKSL